MGLQWSEEMGQRDPQRLRDADEAEHGKVAAAVLNLADIGRIQTRSDRKRGLGESHLLSILPDRCSQQPQRDLVALRRRGYLVLSHCRLPRLSGGERGIWCGRRKRSAAVYLRKEGSSRHIQGRRKAEQQQDRNIVSAEFDLAHVLAITHARSGGKGLLGQTALLAILSQGHPKHL